MVPLTVTFDMPGQIVTGLANGSLVRTGGVVQDTSGKVVMWLREFSEMGVMNGISSGILPFTAATSMLNLGISAVGFTVILKRLKDLEKQLEKVQESLEKIENKIDLSFYANFRAALDLAINSFTMKNLHNRRSSALCAINRFLEAEYTYADLADKELAIKSRIAGEYILALCLAYVAEARCYLELNEFDTAIKRFKEGKHEINIRIERYVDSLLTSKPLMYLHPKLKGRTDLSRLTRIYQWKNSVQSENNNSLLTENSVFELLRTNMVPQRDMSWTSQVNEWIDSLPACVIEQKNVKRDIFGIKQEGREETIQSLPVTFLKMESMIETSQRFNAYQIQTKTISKLQISFNDWINLQPPTNKNEDKSLMYIIPEIPLSL
ncbi:hypothetical protein DO97_06670 [Neosynechococcus sphagnicola sy1]|uniref:Uncharacterized protein n=1 Tax=Neosynechococcus sphagnicola sy1 TaxID=1497020 RepID=A0A098TLE3_9CYAN|nr:tetratricopeptide repeat protein [Neosynechococcus sphagnicola]KGF72697.1 hypothetical protein DO97_06670 [Neosynechococcus sphagnicola sy1]